MGLHSRIILANTYNRPFYYPGETLNGYIVVTSDSEKKVKGLKLRIFGKAKVKFTEREHRFHESDSSHVNTSTTGKHHSLDHSHCSSSSDYVDVEYKDEETYLDVTINIFGYGGIDTTLKSGTFTYPFQFILPRGLPSWFNGEHGSIEYSLEVVMGQSLAFDHKSHIPFHVVGIVDLNNEPTAQVPVLVKACKTFGVIFQSGPLDISLRIPRGGAVPGEYIPFIAEIYNKSSKSVTEYLSLHQEVEYFARGKSKTTTNNVIEILGEALKPGADHIWQNNVLRVPHVTPTTFGTCRLINVKYKLVLEMKISGIGFNLVASTPFVIGNIPFGGAVYQPTVPEQSQCYDPPPPYTEKAEHPAKMKPPSDDDFELL